MRTPSIKTLARVFSDPRRAKSTLAMPPAELCKLPAACARIAECYNMPKIYDVRLTVLNFIEPGLYGVESCETVNGEYADYLNTGETYADTLIYWRGTYRVQSLGAFVETQERNRVYFK